MTLAELVDKINEITDSSLTTIKTQDGRLVELVDNHMDIRVLILDGMVYVNRYRIDELISMTFEEYVEYLEDLNLE